MHSECLLLSVLPSQAQLPAPLPPVSLALSQPFVDPHSPASQRLFPPSLQPPPASLPLLATALAHSPPRDLQAMPGRLENWPLVLIIRGKERNSFFLTILCQLEQFHLGEGKSFPGQRHFVLLDRKGNLQRASVWLPLAPHLNILPLNQVPMVTTIQQKVQA